MGNVNEYGNALFLLAKEENEIDRVGDDLKIVKAALAENAEYAKLLDTPAIQKAEKLALIDEAFGKLHYCVVNLLKILCERHAVYSFDEVISTYSKLYDEHNGIERVTAVTAVPMTEAQISKITEKLANMTGKKIVLKNIIEPEILGGVKLRYSGIQLDGSVKSRLDTFAESLKNINL